ncbi:hypothetical protein JCM11641_005169 [Rhodosporidiobolus odoratus]
MRLLALLPLLALPKVLGWGAAGHEMVAIIAEIHLHPTVLAYIRTAPLLPPYAKGHLAYIASWADKIRMVPEYRGWSGPLHYTSWEGDHPPETCAWGKGEQLGEGGWHSDKDVLHAIANYTTRLERNPEECVFLFTMVSAFFRLIQTPLSSRLPPSHARRSVLCGDRLVTFLHMLFSWPSFNFLVHFLGDVHQPMHLTSRERGGNGDPISWDGRHTNLHSLWDGLLIARTLREQTNYTSPLPSSQIESALIGRIYDPYIRLLLWEGVRSWYRSSLSTWLSCDASASLSASASASPDQVTFSSAVGSEKRIEDVVCPVRWATETHKVTCGFAFPEGYDMHAQPPQEIGGNSQFWKDLKADHSLARLLLQAGLRLAATLNTVFAEPAHALAEERGWIALLENKEEGPVNLEWLDAAER